MKSRTLALLLTLISLNLLGQRKIDLTDQVAFVYFEGRKTNFIVIPNIDRLHTFKIYRKTKTDTSFVQVAERRKPPLPMRYNITPYGVTWIDAKYNTPEVTYKILAFNKKGKEICEVKVMWEDQAVRDKLKEDKTKQHDAQQ